jgi:hypothetical protein
MINKLKLDTLNLGPIETWSVDRINGPSLCGSQSDLDHDPGCRIRNFRDLPVPVTFDLLLDSKDAMLECWKLMTGAYVDKYPITVGIQDHRMSIPDKLMVPAGKDLVARSLHESVVQVRLGAVNFRGLPARPKAPGGQIPPIRVLQRIAGRFPMLNQETDRPKGIFQNSTGRLLGEGVTHQQQNMQEGQKERQ